MITEIAGKTVTLRNMTVADLNDYRRWFIKGLEWTKWDAPWEEMSEDFAESFVTRQSQRIQKTPQGLNSRLEIWVKNTHIGWVTSYYIDNNPQSVAVGLSIPETTYWGRGIGGEALEMWIRHLFQTRQLKYLYCETWSGNKRMVRLALSLGFKLIESDRVVELNGNIYQKLKFKITKLNQAAQSS